jgi:hypothetical protein
LDSRVTKFSPSRKAHKRKKALIVVGIVFLITLLGLVIMLVTPQGNTTIHNLFPSVNTPMDSIVKKEFTKKINSSSMNSDDKEKLNEIIGNVKMSTITKAAKDPATAATLYAQYTGKDKSASRDIIDSVYSDSRLNKIRDDVANNHWINAAKDYNAVVSAGTLNQVLTKAEQNSSNSAKKTQAQASKDYNAAVAAENQSAK